MTTAIDWSTPKCKQNKHIYFAEKMRYKRYANIGQNTAGATLSVSIY